MRCNTEYRKLSSRMLRFATVRASLMGHAHGVAAPWQRSRRVALPFCVLLLFMYYVAAAII